MSIPLIYKDMLINQRDVAETIPVKRAGRIHIHYNESISYQAHYIVYPEC